MLKFNRTKKIILLFLGIILIVFFTGYTITTDENVITNQKVSCVESLSSALDVGENALGTEELKTAYTELEKQISTFNDNDVLVILRKDNINDLAKNTILQMCSKINNGKGITDCSEFKSMLKKGVLPDDVRVNLIQSLNTNDKSINNYLGEIVLKESGAVVFRAMKMIENNIPEYALEISNKILSNLDNYNYDTMRSAISVKSSYFKDLTITKSEIDVSKEKKQFIKDCIWMFENSNDGKLKDAAIFALMNMLDYDAVKTVINHPEIDNEMKLSCVSRNPGSFLTVINGSPTENDIALIIKATEIYPLKELAEPTEKMLEKNPQFDCNELRNAISKMKNGKASDTSRFDMAHTKNWNK